jgi:hypothetical protein
MRNDTELLKDLLGHFTVTEDGDLDYVYNEACDGLRDAGERPEIVDELIQRRSELYGAVANGQQQPQPKSVTPCKWGYARCVFDVCFERCDTCTQTKKS